MDITVDLKSTELSNSYTTILEHAAEISPTAAERTLGPDKENWRQEESDRNSSQNEILRKMAEIQPQTKANINRPSSIVMNTSAESLYANVLVREAKLLHLNNSRQRFFDQLLATKKHVFENNQDRILSSGIKEVNNSGNSQHVKAFADNAVFENARNMELIRQQAQRQMHLICYQFMTKLQIKFRQKYEVVAQTLMNIDKGLLHAYKNRNRILKDLVQKLDSLVGNLKSTTYGFEEVSDMQRLCESLDILEESIICDLKYAEQEKQQQLVEPDIQNSASAPTQIVNSVAAEVEFKSPQIQSTLTASENEPTAEPVGAELTPLETPPEKELKESAPSTTCISNKQINDMNYFCSSDRFRFFTETMEFYKEKVERVKVLQSDNTYSAFRSACQKAINTPVNSIAAVSGDHLKDKFEKIYNFLRGQPYKTANGHISINDHPLAQDYCLLLLAKKFVSQGDKIVSGNTQMAFPIASVMITMWKLVPDFGRLFLAYLYKDSPLLVPYLVTHKQGQALESYFAELGYHLENGEIEKQERYLKRQAGNARLYAAMCITNGRQGDSPTHPHSIENCWHWLAMFITIDPLPDTSATILLEVLQIVSADMYLAYGRQFLKMLTYISHHYFPKLSAGEEGGPRTRLDLLLEKILKEGQIAKPEGLLPPTFW